MTEPDKEYGNFFELLNAIKRGDKIKIISQIGPYVEGFVSVPHPDLDSYLESVKDLPFPSEEQIRGFVSYVTHAHSWYKQLPNLFDGYEEFAGDGIHTAWGALDTNEKWKEEHEKRKAAYFNGTYDGPEKIVRFVFFLDPHAGQIYSTDPETGEEVIRDMRCHSNNLPTMHYREQCGYLNYADDGDFLNLPKEITMHAIPVMCKIHEKTADDEEGRQLYDAIKATLSTIKEMLIQREQIDNANAEEAVKASLYRPN